MKLILASANPGKQRELAVLLAPLGLELLLQSALGIESIEETGSSFVDNALLKARHAAERSGLPALADDSGLEVDALGGAPGVRSARFAGEGASDADNNALLLSRLSGVPQALRTARYRCVLALVRSALDPAPLLAEAQWEGHIALAPQGTGGFGYDPLFLPADRADTAAQLTAEEKNAISHRGRALQALLRLLPDVISH
jgi:XTP/dITP diphosphohydrolase